MVNNRYGVCVRMALGYCSIEWSQVDTLSFSVSGGTGSIDPNIIGTPLVAESNGDCLTDFVIVPDPRENGVLVNTDRFCGNGFVTKTCEYSGCSIMNGTRPKTMRFYIQKQIENVREICLTKFSLVARQLCCILYFI